jgi:hypothetical protein
MIPTISPLGAEDSVWDLPWPRLRIPAYQEIALGSWSLKKFEMMPQASYFQERVSLGVQYVLLASEQTWMTTSALEVESQAPHVAAAQGHVVVMGAGLGLALFNILFNPRVVSVTLVEHDPLVLDLLRQAAQLDKWPGVEKLEINLVDAFTYPPAQPVDYLYIDIWAKTGDPRALPDTQQIQRRVKAKRVSWWSQEIHFLCWLAQKGYGDIPTLDRYREWAQEIDLPLIEQHHPAYMTCIAQMARGYCYQTCLQEFPELLRATEGEPSVC